MTGTFEMKCAQDKSHYFVLKAGNGQVILQSEMYTSKQACENGIESVQENSGDDTKFARMESSNGKHYFNLKAGNGQIIGTSQMYEDKSGMENGIESVKENALEARILECE